MNRSKNFGGPEEISALKVLWCSSEPSSAKTLPKSFMEGGISKVLIPTTDIIVIGLLVSCYSNGGQRPSLAWQLFRVWTFNTENTNLRESITVQLTSCLFCFGFSCFAYVESTTILLVFDQIQTSQAEGQVYSDTSPYGECSLFNSNIKHFFQCWWTYTISAEQVTRVMPLIWTAEKSHLKHQTSIQSSTSISKKDLLQSVK